MKRNEVEAWVYAIADRIRQGQPVEDDRVELKREWKAAKDVARQVGGHANLMRGEPILWAFGVDEGTGVTGVDPGEFSK